MEFISVKLSDIGEVVGGSTPSTKNSDNYDGNIAWITPKDLAGYNKVYISRGERNITEAGFKSCSTKMLPKNSILFSSRAPIGYVAISGNDLCTNQGFKSIIPNDKVDYKFLYYLLKYNKDFIASKGSGSTFKEVSGSVMKSIKLSIPKDKNDQKKISKLLFDIDKKIGLNNEINNNLLEQLKTVFYEWFESKMTDNLPGGWIIADLQDISTFSQGVQIPIEEQIDVEKDGFVRFIRIVDITQGSDKEIRYIEDRDRGHVVESEIFMTRYGTPGILSRNYNGIIANNLFKISPFDRVTSNYLFSALNVDRIQNYIKGNATSSTMPAISFSTLNNQKIIVPDRETLRKFDEYSETIRKKQLNIINENKKLVQLRDTLLPKLMNGEINLDNIEL